MVSVYVRHLLVQLETPDAIRGRVSAVSAVFIGASNELGEFESGLTAKWWGAVRAVVIGGVATLVVTGLWIRLFPVLWQMERFPDASLASNDQLATVHDLRQVSVGTPLAASCLPELYHIQYGHGHPLRPAHAPAAGRSRIRQGDSSRRERKLRTTAGALSMRNCPSSPPS